MADGDGVGRVCELGKVLEENQALNGSTETQLAGPVFANVWTRSEQASSLSSMRWERSEWPNPSAGVDSLGLLGHHRNIFDPSLSGLEAHQIT